MSLFTCMFLPDMREGGIIIAEDMMPAIGRCILFRSAGTTKCTFRSIVSDMEIIMTLITRIGTGVIEAVIAEGADIIGAMAETSGFLSIPVEQSGVRLGSIDHELGVMI